MIDKKNAQEWFGNYVLTEEDITHADKQLNDFRKEATEIREDLTKRLTEVFTEHTKSLGQAGLEDFKRRIFKRCTVVDPGKYEIVFFMNKEGNEISISSITGIEKGDMVSFYDTGVAHMWGIPFNSENGRVQTISRETYGDITKEWYSTTDKENGIKEAKILIIRNHGKVVEVTGIIFPLEDEMGPKQDPIMPQIPKELVERYKVIYDNLNPEEKQISDKTPGIFNLENKIVEHLDKEMKKSL